MFGPGCTICVDESISCWYGLGGEWINIGLPMYVAIDHKPERGCRIHHAACGKSGIMLCLRLVKTATEVEANSLAEDDGWLLHGTKVLSELVSPWYHTDCVVCADSYFASVPAAEYLLERGLKFIGVVKTATRHFPQSYLANIEFSESWRQGGINK